jgi:hypothetical protein
MSSAKNGISRLPRRTGLAGFAVWAGAVMFEIQSIGWNEGCSVKQNIVAFVLSFLNPRQRVFDA